MKVSLGEETLIEFKKGGWRKIVKGKLPFQTFVGPGRLLVKYSWRSKPVTMMQCRAGEVFFCEAPLILTEGTYFKVERF